MSLVLLAHHMHARSGQLRLAQIRAFALYVPDDAITTSSYRPVWSPVPNYEYRLATYMALQMANHAKKDKDHRIYSQTEMKWNLS